MIFRLLKVGLTLLILWLAFYRVSWADLSQSLALINTSTFLTLLFALVLIFIIPSLAQFYLFSRIDMSVSLLSIYRINIISMFYSLIVPGDVAAAIVRVIRLGKANKSEIKEADLYPKVLSVMVWDKLIQILSLLVLFLLFTVQTNSLDSISYYRFPAMIFLFVLLAFIFLGRSTYQLPFDPARPLFKKILHYLSILRSSSRQIRSVDILLLVFLLVFFQLGCILVMDMAPARILGIALPSSLILILASFVRLVRFLPITLSGIGIRESLYPLLAMQYGVSYESLLSLGLLGTSLVICMCLLGGLLELIQIIQKRFGKQLPGIS